MRRELGRERTQEYGEVPFLAFSRVLISELMLAKKLREARERNI